MVNVHIHQFKLGGAVVDAGALAQFQQQWATYRKLITSNDLSHREVGAILHDKEAGHADVIDELCSDLADAVAEVSRSGARAADRGTTYGTV